MTKLDLNNINSLLADLSSDRFRDTSFDNEGITRATMLNAVARVLGCKENYAVDKDKDLNGRGSGVIEAVMYQNLLLAKRVSVLEQQLHEKL